MKNTHFYVTLLALLLVISSHLYAQPISSASFEAASRQMTNEEHQIEQAVTVVWNAFIVAARRGDTRGALKYVSPYSDLAGLSQQELKALPINHKKTKMVGLMEVYYPFATCIVEVRHSNGEELAYFITFAHNGKRWLIDSM